MTESGQIFSDWLHTDICLAIGLNPKANGLYCCSRGTVHKFYREILTKLNTQQVEDIEMHLAIQFNQDTTPASVPAGLIAEWSRSCEAHDYHFGHFFVIGCFTYLYATSYNRNVEE